MTQIDEITKALIDFRDARDWKQFHDSKNLATALSIEIAELNELFLWKDIADSEGVDKVRIKEELADVFAYAFLLAEKHGLDVKEIVLEKIKRNGEKYPVDKAKGTATKYTDL
jgi:NTP pyrophosphatase (non-canonical NTP hydrolase)